MTSYKRGDVVLILFPDSNLQTAKKRPALVIQADNLQTGLPQVIDKVPGNLPSMSSVETALAHTFGLNLK